MRSRARRPVMLVALLFTAGSGCNQSGSRGLESEYPDMSPGVDMAHGGPTVDPGVISKLPKTAEEAETHVAVANNGFVAVAYIGLERGGGSTNGYRFSKDDGTTFEPAASLDSPGGRVASDPVLATDAKNNFYMTWIGYHQNGGQPFDMHVYAAMAPAGSTTFGTPVEVSDNPSGRDAYDKPWILVENDGSVLITYARTSSGGIFAARSTDLATWDNQIIVEDGGFRNLVFPCQPRTGNKVYATYHSGGGIGLRWSNDSGTTWADTDKTGAASMSEPRPAFDDPTCAAAGDEVWVTYGFSDDPFGPAQSAKLNTIRLAHSADGGKTIDNRWDAHDPNAGSFFLHPYLVREATGALDLVYYAGNQDNDTMGSYRRSRSTDNGATWAASLAIKQPVVFTGARDNAKWLGDYVGLAWSHDNLYTSFTDNTNGGVAHVAFYRTASPMP